MIYNYKKYLLEVKNFNRKSENNIIPNVMAYIWKINDIFKPVKLLQ